MDLYRFIDWVLQLPEPEAIAFWQRVVITATTLPEVTAAVEALSASAGDESPS